MTSSSVSLRSKWIFELDTTDTRLVLKALGGRLKDDDIQSAKELGNRLTRQLLRAEESK